MMLLIIIDVFVTVALAIQEILTNPKRILEKLTHIGNGESLRAKQHRETDDEVEEESEFPVWELDDLDD